MPRTSRAPTPSQPVLPTQKVECFMPPRDARDDDSILHVTTVRLTEHQVRGMQIAVLNQNTPYETVSDFHRAAVDALLAATNMDVVEPELQNIVAKIQTERALKRAQGAKEASVLLEQLNKQQQEARWLGDPHALEEAQLAIQSFISGYNYPTLVEQARDLLEH